MKIAIVLLLLLAGCATHHTTSSDFPYEGPLLDPVTEELIDETIFEE